MCCGGGEATIVNSTISSNFYGVKARYYATVTVISSTIADNFTGLLAYYGSEFVISSSTISGNNTGIHLYYRYETATLDNTILSNDTDCYIECCGHNFVHSGGHNISSDATCPELTQPGDQQNTNPLLGPLADNGGPTPTMALLPGSPAIDAGSCPTRTRDQRGLPRPVDDPGAPNVTDACDVGAYEKQ